MHFVKGLASYTKYVFNNLPLWQFVTKPQQTNEHMREVINHSTLIHLLNTIKSIIIQTLEKLCNKSKGKSVRYNVLVYHYSGFYLFRWQCLCIIPDLLDID